jgi:hypothetical protein
MMNESEESIYENRSEHRAIREMSALRLLVPAIGKAAAFRYAYHYC